MADDNNDSASSQENPEVVAHLAGERQLQQRAEGRRRTGPFDRPVVTLAAFGHSACGKSTLLGHLCFQLGLLSQQQLDRLDAEYQRLHPGMGMRGPPFEWYFDRTQVERLNRRTIHLKSRNMISPMYDWTVFDTPGHRDYFGNQIRGLAMADVGLLVVSMQPAEFLESLALENRRSGQREGGIRAGLLAAGCIGVSRLVVAVTKCEQFGEGAGPNDDFEQRFNEVCAQVREQIQQRGKVLEVDVQFIPVSGREGHNLLRPWPHTSPVDQWYRGPTLIEALENCVTRLLLVSWPCNHFANAMARAATCCVSVDQISVRRSNICETSLRQGIRDVVQRILRNVGTAIQRSMVDKCLTRELVKASDSLL
jgi:Elongation factor Tu GTP binding domain